MKPDDVPQWAWDEAREAYDTIPVIRDWQSLVAPFARAIIQARSQAFEEAAAVALAAGPEHYASTHGGLTRNPSEAEAYISQAIRQHSQKGIDNG